MNGSLFLAGAVPVLVYLTVSMLFRPHDVKTNAREFIFSTDDSIDVGFPS